LSEGEVHLPDYMQAAFDQIGYVLTRGDEALPASRALAEGALHDHAQAQRFIATLSAEQRDEVWNCMRLVLEVEAIAMNELHARAAHLGAGVARGLRKAAQKRNSSEADREKWRKRFAELRAQFPEAQKDKVLGPKLADEFGRKWRSMRRYIKAK